MAKQPKLSREQQEIADASYAFARAGASVGCPMEQIENFMLAGVILQKKQLEIAAKCRECDAPDGPKAILAGGGRGPLALTTPILTRDGWKTMGTIEEGDVVFDENGRRCNVLSVSEIFRGRECYEMEFDTGEKIISDSVHEWLTISKAEQKAIDRRNPEFREKRRLERGKEPKHFLIGKNVLPDPPNGSIKSTLDIFNTAKCQSGREVNHRVPVTSPLRLNEKQFSLAPYLLGLWLGDGDSYCGGLTTADDLHEAFILHGFNVAKRPKLKFRYAIYGLSPILNGMNLIANKHIPEHYFWGSSKQRIELVQGLMDTDGTVCKNGRASFCNTNKNIAFGFVRLLRSLGVKCRATEGTAKLYGREISKVWKVSFTSRFNPFQLNRKASKYVTASRKTGKNHYIISIKKVKSVPVRCIAVDSNSHLFLCGESLIPTHNSAKSHAILAQIFCDDCQRIKGLKVLCLRKVGRANKEQIQDFRKKLLGRLEHNYKEQAQTIEFKNGSLVILGNFKDEKDIDKYLGLEYDLIYIMESNQLTQSKKINILSCLRTNKQNWRPRCYQDTNPGGIDHAANKLLFVEPWKAGKETETRYIHSTVDDNKFVDSGYKEYLEKLVGWQREAWLNGSWEFMAGAFFTNFDERIHVYPNQTVNFFENQAVKWFAGFDYGYAHPACFILCCQDRNGNIYAVDELHQAETVIEQHASDFIDMCWRHNITVSDLDFIAAGRDCFSRKPDGKTIAGEFEENGITLTPVEIDRVNAWGVMQQRFGDVTRGFEPTTFIHKSCTNLVSQIPMAQCHETKKGDIMKMNADPETKEGGDDALDAFRDALVMEGGGFGSAKSINSIQIYQPLRLGFG